MLNEKLIIKLPNCNFFVRSRILSSELRSAVPRKQSIGKKSEVTYSYQYMQAEYLF